MNKAQAESIRAVCDWFDTAFPNLECDGLSRVLSHVMHRAGQPHVVMTGTLPAMGGTPHWWIESGDCVVDYRLRRWLGDEAAHGVFDLVGSIHEGLPYRREAGWPPVPEWLFKVLTGQPDFKTLTSSPSEWLRLSRQQLDVYPTPPESV